MHEIRWHGRGGQGAVTSSKILAAAAYRSGFEGVTAAPTFGAERRGAPVTASTRFDHAPIRMYSQVVEPNVVVVLDESLLAVANATAGLRPGGVIIVNSTRSRGELGLPETIRVVTSDVTGAAESVGLIVGGEPMVNTAILGSIAKATGLITMESIGAAISDAFPPAAAAKNIQAAQIAFDCTAAGGLP